MKRWLLTIFFLLAYLFVARFPIMAQTVTPPQTISVDLGDGMKTAIDPNANYCGCPEELNQVYSQLKDGQTCATDFQDFMSNPTKKHFWIQDTTVTAQGKANDRARQFIYWVMTHTSIDNHPVLYQIWGTTRNIAYFFTILSAALFGLAIIIGQRTNFASDVKVWPSITKVLLGLLFISFSATIVVTIVQLSGILMKFFIENLGGRDLFNIYFSGASQESNYITFQGCRDLNVTVQEAAQTEMFILKLTNISYYLMGGALILRVIILWFLLFVAPFLAILEYFHISKNVGWVWIGTFFQWVFYGPLLALFLGALAAIWKAGIPFIFDFSRAGTVQGYIYPTAINILYGGPAQQLSAINNGNYVDTYVEYIITLIMLWAVTIFPWFLLRTFRDYCCDGINAIKNMLLSNLNNLRGPTPPSPSPATPSGTSSFSSATEIKNQATADTYRRIETVEEIKKANTEEIAKSLNIKAGNLTDIASLETNKNVSQNVTKNINYLKNPSVADTTAERLRYMNIRSELSTRASKSDPVARQIMNSILYSRPQQVAQRETIISSLPKAIPITQVISVRVKLPQEKAASISSSVISYGAANIKIASDIAATTAVPKEKVTAVLNKLGENVNTPVPDMIPKISSGAHVEKEAVAKVIKEFSKAVSADNKLIEEVAKNQNIDVAKVKEVVTAQAPIIAEPHKNIDQAVEVSPKVSIDEYEQVKKMWRDQYEKGEIPLSDNIKTRPQWVDQDIVLITNTLNKLLSDDKSLKEEALDEVGFILPIFLVNNLTGEQLVTYLKAKVEAAKQVKELQDKEAEVTARLKAESERVEISRPKKAEAEKEMEMKEEIKND